jgi:hypothetical protein
VNSKGTHIVVAPDEVPKYLLAAGHHVDFVNLSPFPTPLPLMRSLAPLRQLHEVKPANYDLCWHMFRDPVQDEVTALLPQFEHWFPINRTINPASSLRYHFKHVYLPILGHHGIGLTCFPGMNEAGLSWDNQGQAVLVSTCRRFAKLYDYNNNRGDYPEREKRGKLVVEYLDAAHDGKRSFFRAGFAAGTLIPGWIYTSESTQLVQKTGTCKFKEPHTIPERFHAPLLASFADMGINACHFEGLYLNDQLRVFDVNPYPTSYGTSLSPISEGMAKAIAGMVS